MVWSHSGSWVGWLATIVFWGVIIWAMYAAVRAGMSSAAAPDRPPDHRAFEILAERLAHGEISEHEYKTRVDALRRSAQSEPGPGQPESRRKDSS